MGFRLSMTTVPNLRSDGVAFADSVRLLDQSPIRIVYIAAGNAPDLEALGSSAGIVVTSDVNKAKELDTLKPLDVLMFDSAIASKLDQAWVKQRYSHGMAIVGVNIALVNLAQMVADRDAAESWATQSPPKGRFYSLLQLYVTGDNAADVARFQKEYHPLINADGSHTPMEGVNSHLSISARRAQVPISDPQLLSKTFHSIESTIVVVAR